MADKLRTIRLYGKLGAKFGRLHHFSVHNVREAIRALCVMLPGFEQELRSSGRHGVAYAVFLGRTNIGIDQLEHPPGKSDIRIAPVLQGSKRGGVLQTIVGIILVVVGAVVSYFGGGAGTPIMQAGFVMIAGGVLQMLSPQASGSSAKDKVDNGASYNFNGAVNPTAQGNPVGLLYGRMRVGGAIISGGVYAEDQA